MKTKAPIKVLIVDDSAVVRQALASIMAGDPHLQVTGTAADPLIAIEKIRRHPPDVITLDVAMPRMDGLTFLRKIMTLHPIPVVMCSSFTGQGSDTGLRALEYGAVDLIEKPRLGTKQFLEEARIRICDVVKAAAHARLRKLPTAILQPTPKLSADAVLAKGSPRSLVRSTEKVVVVGASTGGTEALRLFLEAMPVNAPGIVIVQHMPEHFTASFAQRLNSLCAITVKEAGNGDVILPGEALIAPGNRHLLLQRRGAHYVVEVREGPLVSRHRPSVDVLFRSAARYAGRNAVGVIMTGMGDDGARGMLELHQAGACTLAQNEASSVVFGMPKEAIRLGAADYVLPLEGLAPAVLRACRDSEKVRPC